LTLGKIDLLVTSFAGMFFIEFIGKDFRLFSAIGTFAGEGFQIFELLVTGTMQWGCHKHLLIIENIDLLPNSYSSI
jgi:hypothetical protein